MTITDQITALLAADPACNGRVTGETVRAIAEVASERAAIVAWLRGGWGGAWETVHRSNGIGAVHVPRLLADAIERGDFGAGVG